MAWKGDATCLCVLVLLNSESQGICFTTYTDAANVEEDYFRLLCGG
jgi:hypothetical protein